MKSEFRKKIDRNIQQALTRAIKYNYDSHWFRILGYTKEEFLEDLRKEIEIEFEYKDFFSKRENGKLFFTNYGKAWVLSKRIPVSLYNYNDLQNNELKKAWSLKNLYPEIKNRQNKKRKVVSKKYIEQHSLYDILPIGVLKFE